MQHSPIRQAKSIDNVFNCAYWHLSQQDFTIHEIRSKLERKTDNSDWIDTVLKQLIDNSYIKQDLAFAINFCEAAISNQFGKTAIQKKLKMRGISNTDIETALLKVIEQRNISFNETARDYLDSRYISFEGISKEKVYSQMTNRGFTHSQIDHALAQHPAKDTLYTALAIKAANADLTTEIMKRYKKKKGKLLILNELKQHLIDVTLFEQTINELSVAGDIDFYQSCYELLASKKYDLSDFKDKSKAYAYLSRKGFSSDEITESINAMLKQNG